MTLDQLRYALELQRTKNFSRAAEACHITQPSLSIQIAKLEEELGLLLFERTRAGVAVTSHGEELLKQARLVIVEAARLPELASSLKGEVQGEFRLGIIPTLAPSLLPLFLGEFGRAFPKVRLSILEEPTERLVQAIDEGQLDGAILSTPARCPESLMERVLFYEPFVMFASTGHRLLSQKKIATEQISSSEILLLDDTHCLRDQVLQLCKSRGRSDIESRLQIRSGSLQTLLEVIRKEEGFTLLPALAVRFLSLREQEKNVRHFEKPVPSRKISLVFHRSKLKRSVIEALRDQISASLPKDVYVSQAGHDLRVLSPALEHFEL